MEAEGLGGGDVVTAPFGDVQVVGVFDGRDDGSGVSGEVADSMAEGRPGLLPQVADEVRGGCRGR